MKRLPIAALLILVAFGFGQTSMKVAVTPIVEQPVAPPIVSQKDVRCLALNIYWEAKNDAASKVGVGYVVMNRVADKHYPDTVCDVVKQSRTWKGNPIRNKCSFSWFCDGKSDKPKNMVAWETSQVIAKAILRNEIGDPTNGSLMYHADYVKPYWRNDYQRTMKLGVHIFYKRG